MKALLKAAVGAAVLTAWEVFLWRAEGERQHREIQQIVAEAQARYDAQMEFLEGLSPRARRRYCRAYLEAAPKFYEAYGFR